MTPDSPSPPPPGAESVRARRTRERDVWRKAFMVSVALHILLFLLWPTTGGDYESPFAAAGPREADDRAADGAMQAIAMRSAAPDPLRPPPTPTFEVDLPDPVEVDPEATPEIEIEPPELPAPGRGDTTGDDPQDQGDAGIQGETGAGDGGTTGEGEFRLVPPTPRGIILPPTGHRALRDRALEVRVFVNESGRVVPDSTHLVPPTGDRSFNEQLVREASQWVFEPARSGGVAVASWWSYRIDG